MRRLLLLYLGPASYRASLAERHGASLRDAGIELVAADDYLVESDRALFADALELPPAERVTETLLAIESYARKARIDGILAQSEAAMLPGSLVARRLGLPGIAPEAALRCANKFLCREALHAAGVPSPRFTLVRDAAGVRRFAEGRWPVILKGAASTMSRLVTKVDSDAEVEAAVERMRAGIRTSTDIARLRSFCAASGLDAGCAPSQEFLAESFAEGAPVETDGVVTAAGAPITYGVTEQVLTAPPLFYIEGYLLPSDRPGVEAVSDRALHALGVRGTGFSIELRAREWSAEVIEVNGRLGEDDGFGELFRAAAGREPFLDAVALALGGTPAPLPSARTACAIAYRCWYEGGVVRRVPTPEECRSADPAILRVGISAYAGERIERAPHPGCFPHVGWALARDAKSSRAAYGRARAAVDALPFEIGA